MQSVPYIVLEAACAEHDRAMRRARRAIIALALALLVCACALGACLSRACGAISAERPAVIAAGGEASGGDAPGAQ